MTPKQRAKKYRELAERCFSSGDDMVHLKWRYRNVYPEAIICEPSLVELLFFITRKEDAKNIKILLFLFCEQIAMEAES